MRVMHNIRDPNLHPRLGKTKSIRIKASVLEYVSLVVLAITILICGYGSQCITFDNAR